MSFSSDEKAQVELEVREVFSDLVEASKALDTERYLAFFDQATFIGLNADGTIWKTLDDLKALIHPAFRMIERVDSLEFDNVFVSVITPTMAILVNEYEQSALLKNGKSSFSAGGGAQVWSKLDGRWKLVSVSSSINLEKTKDTEG